MSRESIGMNGISEQYEKELKQAYQLGLLHGINAQSMASVERDVMEFDEYGWNIE